MVETGVALFVPPHIAPDQHALSVLERLSVSGLLACPPVALPDLHCKPLLETPSSTATATHNTLVLGLSSPSPNCGMALVRTSLCADDMSESRLDRFFAALAGRFNASKGAALSVAEMQDVLLKGSAAAITKYDLAPDVAEYMEQRGNALAADADPQAVLQAIPHSLQEIGRHRFARVGRGNHFLELQVVDEICDPAVSRSWGLEKDQVVVMYHADSDYVGGFVGRLYAHRRKNNWKGRLYEWRIKFPFQLTIGRASRLWQRLNYHVIPRRWTPLPVDSPEGKRTLLALQAAGNYAYANRLAVLSILGDELGAIWGMNGTPNLLWDAPHNGIRQEQIGGERLWVHRHNAARVEPPSQTPSNSPFAKTGHPVLIPGSCITSSYLCVADEGAAHTLHSADHGAGHTALKLGRPLHNGAATRLYTYKNGLPEICPHLSDDGLESVTATLQAHHIARPVARLRPLAVLKKR